ncbi:hypothetical protein GA0115246_111691 [Streptomyces sp. SolWspMP-sol7th]|nr:hypothetical protein GA0115246_111691 [Streptomyces sp. SolWspMP-sol7th]
MPLEKRVSPASRIAFASSTAASLGATSFLILASFARRGRTFSTVWRSARISSVLIVSMSSFGETLPSTCTTLSSLKARITWQIASVSRMFARNLLPSPSPSLAPRTMPAMSTKSTVAGRIRAEPNNSASFGSRGSGTPTTPTFGSIVAKG